MMNVIGEWSRRRFFKSLSARTNGDLIAITLRGSSWRRVGAIRELGCRPEHEFGAVLIGLVRDSSPGVRRAAAWALGVAGCQSVCGQLVAQVQRERVDVVRFTMAVAAVRCGAVSGPIEAGLKAAALRKMSGAYGSRPTGDCAGFGLKTVKALWALAGTDQGQTFSTTRARLREMLDFEPGDREAVVGLGLMADPRDFQLLDGLWATAGRRMRLSLILAMGLHGDPRWIKRLLMAISAMDVDPAHGFAQRSEAATALGRLGLSLVVPALVRALENEALDHEGRPGAGLGIQRSVRLNILGALGELGGARRVLLDYLDNTSGTATGGYYLVAMDGLRKTGDATGLAAYASGEAVLSANIVGVIAAIDGPQAVSRWLNDPRALVRSVAQAQSGIEDQSAVEVISEP
jgi:HEAT repeat protein